MVKSGRILTMCIILKLVKYSDESLEFDIVKGEFTTIEKYSYAMALNVIATEEGAEFSSRCGASLLTQRLMLTAAHCLAEEKVLMLETFTGSTNRHKGLLRKVHSYTKHRDYQESPVKNDIGIFRLFKDLDLFHKCARAALLVKPPSENPEVAGWGLVSDDGHLDPRLKFTRQKILPTDQCEVEVGKIPDGCFCAMDPHGYTAQGDSGSALVVRHYIEIGVVSFSRIQDKTITIYSNTSYFLRWIHRAAKRLECGSRKRKHKYLDLSVEKDVEVHYLSNATARRVRT